MMEINDFFFKKLFIFFDEEEFFEIEKSKKKLKLNLFIQIGYFILQYVKLYMLQFYYDFMDRFVDCVDFEYCEMDIDFVYMVILGFIFEFVIKFEL